MLFDKWAKSWYMPSYSYRYHALLPGDGENRVVGVGSPCCGIDENVDDVVEDWRGDRLLKHDLNEFRLENLLQGVKGQAGELRLDQVGPVLHDCLEFDVPVCRLPPAPTKMPEPSRFQKKSRTNKHKNQVKILSAPGNKVKHMDALCSPALGLTSHTSQLDTKETKEGLPSESVAHLHEPGVEVDLAGKGGDGQEGGVAHDEEGGDGFLRVQRPGSDRATASETKENVNYIKEAWVDVGSLLEDNDVASGPLRRGYLRRSETSLAKITNSMYNNNGEIGRAHV